MRGKRSQEYQRYRRQVAQETRPNRPQGAGTVDHIVPVAFGFKWKIPPALMGSRDNLQLMPLNDNLQKGQRITPKAIAILRRWGYNDLADYYEWKLQ